jgi:hypothetical protein
VPPIFAYFDPGSGSIIIQAAIAALVAGPILLRNKIAQGVNAARRAVVRGREESGTTPTARR